MNAARMNDAFLELERLTPTTDAPVLRPRFVCDLHPVWHSGGQ